MPANIIEHPFFNVLAYELKRENGFNAYPGVSYAGFTGIWGIV